MLGPLLFSTYLSPISRIISSFGLSYHIYADDITILLSFSNPLSSFSALNDCTQALSDWLMSNGLLLNPAKSDVMWSGTRSQLQTTSGFNPNLQIAGTPIKPSKSIKIVGVTFDEQLNFSQHVSEVCRVANFHLRALRHIRRYLDTPTANMLAVNIIGARMDYCNSLFTGMSNYDLLRMQRVQNRAARIVSNTKGVHTMASTSLLRELHWLPVANRVDYKVALLTFKALTCHQPDYLHSLLLPYQPARSLRSSSGHLLTVPPTISVLASKAFSSYAPRLWNRLPQSIRVMAFTPTSSVTQPPSPHPYLAPFKTALKTFLFDCPPCSLVK